MRRERRVDTYAAAVAGIGDGATIMVGGFGNAGTPMGLIEAVLSTGARDLTVIANNAGIGGRDMTVWIEAGMVSKVICSYPRTSPACVALWRQGKMALEVIPQGTLTERMRCAGAGLGGVYSPVSAGTVLGEGKEHRMMNGRQYVLDLPLGADFALIRAETADRYGNLTFNKTARNFAPIMATAAKMVIVEATHYLEEGAIDPEMVVTPGILVDRIVKQGAPA
jgi:3-oxoadipate CoA-transferase, alpha subunit